MLRLIQGKESNLNEDIYPKCKGRTNRPMSTAALKCAKFGVLIILLCSIHCTAGTCKYYGHSCWGAHGKRNGNAVYPDSIAASSEDVPNFPLFDRFFMSTLAGQNNNGASNQNRENTQKEQLVENGEQIRPWNDAGKWQTSQDDKKILGDINSELMENGYQYLTRYPFTPLEEAKLRYLLMKHLSDFN